ncbi:hypothetical protein RN001_014298 [Aquatica leii]|uniref:Phosphatidylinositol N-acetylglucosaminyltransferase subunit Q n=1 Tax=Aquatica leii TaxID=1421715 RepID=A0AAN7QDT3_9COLE|nr:hypothetical protein RN001_014298 [Aquatica leii]
MRNVFIFIPDTFVIGPIGTLEGFVETWNDTVAFYITNDKFLPDTSTSVIGFCSDTAPSVTVSKRDSSWMHINNKNGHITVYGLNDCCNKYNCITYDYNSFRKSDLCTFNSENYGKHFETLANVVQEKYAQKSGTNGCSRSLFCFILVVNYILLICNILHKILLYLKILIFYSATALHLFQTIDTIKWVLLTLRQKRNITLTIGNIIVSKIADFLFGLILLYFVLEREAEFIEFVQNTTESIIQSLEHLLNFLMGSPVGLKLNFAFNKTLGTFFLYHIALWRAFLHATSPLLRLGLYLLIIPGAFGLSFQAALISDLITFSTFHVYCIYVYATRFYGVQIKSLVSLWRLFIGRKYNPLRKRVDSYQYTHHQLFIGTLGFTVLLFLLPTTFLYYAVFTVFRLFLISLDGILLRLRYCLQRFPIYVTVLWIIDSPCVRGAVKLVLKNNEQIPNSTLYATLQTLSLWQSILNTLPKILVTIPPTSWKFVFHSVVMGSLL